ncbi:MAG: hypothetical protein M3Y33_19885, partial [Actinomycetota bacterium]|nr:hypothetical protein [Actinomycetota bacterium]
MALYSAAEFDTAATPSATVSAPAPPGVSLGDQLLIWVTASAASITWTTPSGWTAATVSHGQNCSAQLFVKTAASGDVTLSSSSGSYTLTASSSHSQAGIIAGVSGQSGLDPAAAGSGTLLSSASTTVTAPSVTTADGSDLLIWLAVARDTSAAQTITIPAGYTSQASGNTTASGATVSVTAATSAQSAAGATGAVSGTLSASDDGGALLVSVALAASAAASITAAGT